MTELDQIDGLQVDVDALERTLGDASAMARTFDQTLRGMQSTLGETTRDLGNLTTGFSGGLRRAFDGVVFDGMKLSDAMKGVAQSMVDTAYAAAINPVAKHAGGLLSDGINAAVSGVMPFANGAPFSQGRVTPFAKGCVVSGATTFPMRGGAGLMGEAGPEAIMPLTRGADGRLGVSAQGGRAVHVTMHITTPDVQGFQRSQGQIAAQLGRALSAGHRNR
ncbi:phage tail tape measure protein [Loktanella sp. SALINAS62]|uniref:phage tail tape measure protein n=1 Tax=Loktanella sp. SALINAS62 TaxID=2706124 RepID=UPI001B8BE658|nr:phage tail tape measure protein [Loktanella sp. SALINAS62]MBS1303587.1 phage tail tape measure protein [Loktanella sp. SALINAS62]